jgi:hypothetical protein
MPTLLQDIRYAFRGLLRNRIFAGVTILTLALGIGANTAIFGVLSSLIRPLNGKRRSNPPSQVAEPVLKCGYGSSDERSPGKTTDPGRDSADCGGVCN